MFDYFGFYRPRSAGIAKELLALEKYFADRESRYQWKITETKNDNVSIVETENGHKRAFVLPGFAAEDIELAKEPKDKGFSLVLKAEKESAEFGKMSAKYEYYVDYKSKNITSKMENGILVVDIEEYKPEPKKLEIQKLKVN